MPASTCQYPGSSRNKVVVVCKPGLSMACTLQLQSCLLPPAPPALPPSTCAAPCYLPCCPPTPPHPRPSLAAAAPPTPFTCSATSTWWSRAWRRPRGCAWTSCSEFGRCGVWAGRRSVRAGMVAKALRCAGWRQRTGPHSEHPDQQWHNSGQSSSHSGTSGQAARQAHLASLHRTTHYLANSSCRSKRARLILLSSIVCF